MSQSAIPVEPANRHVLVVEDDLFFSVRIENMLQGAGYIPQVVTDAVQAVACAASVPTALVIVNFGSDRLSPAEVTRRVKALPDAPPVLGFVPHKWMPQVRPAALGAGCDLLVANSALVRRLPQLAARLAPLDGANVSIAEAAALGADEEEENETA